MAGIHFTAQEKQRIPLFNQFIVSALTHCVSTTLIGYRRQPPAAAPDPQLVS